MLPSRLGQIKIRIYVEYVDQIYNHPIYIRIRRIFRSKFWQELPKKPSTTEAVLDLFQLRLALGTFDDQVLPLLLHFWFFLPLKTTYSPVNIGTKWYKWYPPKKKTMENNL